MIARSKLEEAPKDVARLEILRPTHAPTMGERYDMAIAKERRLEASSQPEVGNRTKKHEKRVREQVTVEAQDEEIQVTPRKTSNAKIKNKKQKIELDKKALENTNALQEEDEVKEGIDWSASDDSSDDNSD
jgi:hypothetical protein